MDKLSYISLWVGLIYISVILETRDISCKIVALNGSAKLSIGPVESYFPLLPRPSYVNTYSRPK